MKILHVVEPFSSGITTFITYLVNGMSENENIVLHGTRVSSDELEKVRGRFEKGTKFILWKHAVRQINPFKDFLALIQLIKVISRIKPAVIHLHSSKAGFLGRVAGILFKTKIFYTPNGLSFARKDISNVKRYFFEFLESFASKISGRVICCSKSEMELLNEIGVSSNYINNGTLIDLNHSKSKIESEVITIGCLALLTEQKDPLTFNQIAHRFIENDRVKFLWIGDGHLRHLITSSNVTITGWLDSDNKNEYFEMIDIYLSCSLWEGLPFSVLEAMSKKQTLLLRHCVGNVDLVREGINGHLFNTADEAVKYINELIVDRDKLREYGNKSLYILKQEFDAHDMIDSYKNLYQIL